MSKKPKLPDDRPTQWHESNALIAACDQEFDLAQRYVEAMNDDGLDDLIAALESVTRLAKAELGKRKSEAVAS